MRKLLFEMAYDGSRYHGYQVQQNALSVAEVVQDAVETVFKKREDIVGCSRSDAGVHANQYFFHMETGLSIPTEAAVIALNNCLPGDVAILSCREVPPDKAADFHARYSVCWKEYVYKIWNSKVKNPFLQNRALQVKYPVDAELLDRCAQEFIGIHDFRGFCSAGAKPTQNYTRIIYAAHVRRDGDLIEFRVAGDGFLYNMVRIMVGTLLLASQGKLREGDVTAILASLDRERAGITAAAQGLYLNRVSYLPYGEKARNSSEKLL